MVFSQYILFAFLTFVKNSLLSSFIMDQRRNNIHKMKVYNDFLEVI